MSRPTKPNVVVGFNGTDRSRALALGGILCEALAAAEAEREVGLLVLGSRGYGRSAACWSAASPHP